MFYGLPVIAGSKDGSADALLNGKLGILVDPDNQEEINQAIEKVINDKAAFKPDHHLLMEHFSFEIYKNNLKNKLLSV
jgi:glycosyltransferase involved in cell wall biosynthesis